MVVTNTGDTVLTNVTVTDDKIATTRSAARRQHWVWGRAMTCYGDVSAPDQRQDA